MLGYFLLFIGFGLIGYSLLCLKRDAEQSQQLLEVVNEAKLVQQKLIKLLKETKEITDLLVEQAEAASKVVDNKFNNPINKQEIAQTNINPRSVQIKEMRNQGMSMDEIAKSMSIGKGEVQLILNLLDKEVTNQ